MEVVTLSFRRLKEVGYGEMTRDTFRPAHDFSHRSLLFAGYVDVEIGPQFAAVLKNPFVDRLALGVVSSQSRQHVSSFAK